MLLLGRREDERHPAGIALEVGVHIEKPRIAEAGSQPAAGVDPILQRRHRLALAHLGRPAAERQPDQQTPAASERRTPSGAFPWGAGSCLSWCSIRLTSVERQNDRFAGRVFERRRSAAAARVGRRHSKSPRKSRSSRAATSLRSPETLRPGGGPAASGSRPAALASAGGRPALQLRRPPEGPRLPSTRPAGP